MDANEFYLSALSDYGSINNSLNVLVSLVEKQIVLNEFLCVVILLTVCLVFVFFNRRV